MRVLLFFTISMLGVFGRRSHPDRYINAMLQAEHRRVRRFDSKNESAVCYGHRVGCFTWKELEFSGYLPNDPGTKGLNISFNLYARENGNDTPVVMLHDREDTYNNVSALRSTNKTLFVLAHGLGGSGNSVWVVKMKNALLEAMDANVLVVDWKHGCALPNYLQAVANTMSVGRAAAAILHNFDRVYGYPPKNIHYIGFSLGAQVGGFAGRHYHSLSGQKFGRLTLLDAAAPGFEKYGVHVVKGDSEFTMAVHTSAGDSILTGRVGMVTPIGHVDFYPNGGVTQPGCEFYEFRCHHDRAPLLLLEAIANSQDPEACRYVGQTCEEEWNVQATEGICTPKTFEGEMSLTSSGRGKLFVETSHEAPFCKPIKKEDLPST